MPKFKPHSGMKKRVKITGKGKLRREQANRRHNFEHKPSTRTRRLAGTVAVSKGDTKKVRKLLGR
jgi:large subunit ribosomal protein L35